MMAAFSCNNIYIYPFNKVIVSLILSDQGHTINSDNGLISQELLLKSEFLCQFNVAMYVAYPCLKYGVFITILSVAIRIFMSIYLAVTMTVITWVGSKRISKSRQTSTIY